MSEEFLEICLDSETRPGQYRLIAGPATYTITLNPETSFAFSDGLRRLERVLVGETAAPDLLRELGVWLWRALLPESAPAQERKALAQALRTGHAPLLLTLPGILDRLPWELLCDPEQAGERGFVARRRPLIRLSSSEAPLDTLKPPLRVLLLISSPPSLGDDSRVDIESERAAVEQAVCEMRKAGYMHLLVEDIVTPQRVQRHLVRFKPHIVHYIGHGAYSESSGGVLLWEDEQGNETPINAERLANLLRPRKLRAVVLHACQTGKSNAQAEMRGIAEALIKEDIPVVLSQQANLTYESSQRASEVWYTALTAGESFAEALFEVRLALSQADRPDWAVPILQGSRASLAPLLDETAAPGRADPLLTSPGAASDIPAPTGVFVGRHRELRELRLILEIQPGSGPVMVLITGPGGVGKSTLAAQAIIRYGRAYKAALTLRCEGYQGIDFFLQSMDAFLKRLGMPGFLEQSQPEPKLSTETKIDEDIAFLKRLGMPGFLEQSQPEPKLSTETKIDEAIAALNAAGPLLLVIDNLESVQGEDQTVRDAVLLYLLRKLLTNLRSGRVLVTGRYAVKDLLPQGRFAANLRYLDLDDLSRYETNQLLLRHSALAQVGETTHAILLNEFGGLPIVYDWLNSSAASQSLDLLIQDVQGRITRARKQRSAQEWQMVRQQAIEFAALDATVERLSEPSRTLLAQLSIFQLPFPLAAIEDGLGAVRDAWQPLLDWSLLRYNPHEQSYHLHSLTRRYAENQLEEQLRKQTQAQLATWYENYANQESHELSDYLEAHRLLRATGKVRQAGILVIQLDEILIRLGLYSLLRTMCLATLSDLQDSSKKLRAGILHTLGMIAQDQGEYGEAQKHYEQSLEITKQLENFRGRVITLYQLGVLSYLQRDYKKAQRLYAQSLEIVERLSHPELRAGILHQLGMVALDQGEYEEARKLYTQSLEADEQLVNQKGRAGTLLELGNLCYLQGEYGEAQNLYTQTLCIYKRLEDRGGQAKVLHQLGMISQDQGEYDEARRLYGESLEVKDQLGDTAGLAETLFQLGKITQKQGEYEEAQKFYAQCLEIFERLGDKAGLARILHQLGIIAQEQGEIKKARRFYIQSFTIFKRLGYKQEQAVTLQTLGTIAQEQGEIKKARRFYIQSFTIFKRLGNLEGLSITLHALGIIAQDQGKLDEARSFHIDSLKIKERLGNQEGLAASLYQLGTIAQDQEEYKEAQRLYRRSLEISERLGLRGGQARNLYQLGKIAQKHNNYEEAQNLYKQSLGLFERLGDPSGLARSLRQLGVLAYEQADYEKALTYMIQSYILFDTLGSSSRALVQGNIALVRLHMDEETFVTHWHTLAGDRPLSDIEEQDTIESNEEIVLTIEELPNIVASLILQGTDEQRQQFAAVLVEVQQRFPPEATPITYFLECLAAALRGETPEVGALEEPFTELWQKVEEALNAPADKARKQEEEKHGEAD